MRYLAKTTVWLTVAISIIAIAWIFSPIAIPIPWFSSPFVSALEEEAKLQSKTYTPDESATIGKFIPTGSKIEDAEKLLQHEWFSCSPFKDIGAKETSRLGVSAEKYRHFKTCVRITRFHPFGRFGWNVDLFADRNGIIESARVQRYYDGL